MKLEADLKNLAQKVKSYLNDLNQIQDVQIDEINYRAEEKNENIEILVPYMQIQTSLLTSYQISFVFF